MKIEHLAIVVSDLQRAKDFFCTYFGGTVSAPDYHNPRTGFHSCFVTFDGETRLELMKWAEVSPLDGVEDCPDLAIRTAGAAGSVAPTRYSLRRKGHSLFHLSMSVGGKEQVDALTARLQADSYTVRSAPRTTGDGYYESVIVPFDGIEVEITI